LRVDAGGPLEGVVEERVHRRDHVRLLVTVRDEEFEAVAPIAEPPALGDRVRLSVDPDGLAVLGDQSDGGE
jgi:thiamine transport system ATP-binding protein